MLCCDVDRTDPPLTSRVKLGMKLEKLDFPWTMLVRVIRSEFWSLDDDDHKLTSCEWTWAEGLLFDGNGGQFVTR